MKSNSYLCINITSETFTAKHINCIVKKGVYIKFVREAKQQKPRAYNKKRLRCQSFLFEHA